MNLRTLLAVALALAVGLTVYFLWPVPLQTPEDAVRQTIAGMIAAAAEGKPAEIMVHVAPSFRGPGGMGKDEFKGYVLGQFLRNPKVVVLNPTLTVTEKQKGLVAFEGTFLFVGENVAAVPADNASARKISGEFEKIDNVWQCTAAQSN
jgi:hypothetical protein